jgi:hypothetical protein
MTRRRGSSAGLRGRASLRSLRSALKRLPTIVKQIGAVIGVLAATVGLVAGVRELWPKDPPKMAVEISAAEVVERNVTLRDFLITYLRLEDVPDQDNQPIRDALELMGLRSNISDDALKVVGHSLSFRVTFIGYKGKILPVRWSMYDAETRERFTDPDYVAQTAYPHGALTSDAEEDTANQTIWVPRPITDRDYIVRIQIFNDRSPATQLAVAEADSEPLR